MVSQKILAIVAGTVLVGLATLAITMRSTPPPVTPTANSALSVAASFYPLYFFASTIGGEQAVVQNMTPAGSEPHDYELTAHDVIGLTSSRLIIVNGAFEPWVEKIKRLVAGKNVEVLETARMVAEVEQDPHVWLDPALAAKQVDVIVDGFIGVDPEHSDAYRARAANLKNNLGVLDQEFREGLRQCGKKEFVTSHAAFGHLARQYAITQVPIAGISPDEEPSAKALADITTFVRKNNIQYIFFESLISPKLSETIANEVGAKTLTLNPIEGLTDEELAQGKNYFTVMRQNLANLKIALQCP